MAFIVEDGTIVAGANSYASVEYADGYFATRLNDSWTSLELDAKQAFLVKATDYINLRWGSLLRGVVSSSTQALLFPRVYCIGELAQYPDGLLRATCEYAFRVSVAEGNNLAPDVVYDDTGRIASQVKEKVGPIEESRKWEFSNSDSVAFLSYRIPDTLMVPFIYVGSGRVVR